MLTLQWDFIVSRGCIQSHLEETQKYAETALEKEQALIFQWSQGVSILFQAHQSANCCVMGGVICGAQERGNL